MTPDRREFLVMALAAPIALSGSRQAGAADAACYDPDSISLAQQGLRRSLEFTERSSDPAKHCDLCAFFSGTKAGCGNCQILSGPVVAGGLCSSFAPRATK